LHDLAGLAVAALRRLDVDPGLLERAQAAGRRQPLDRRDLLADDVLDLGPARAGRLAVDQDGAAAALADATAALGTRESEVATERKLERRISVGRKLSILPVHAQHDGGHRELLPGRSRSETVPPAPRPGSADLL